MVGLAVALSVGGMANAKAFPEGFVDRAASLSLPEISQFTALMVGRCVAAGSSAYSSLGPLLGAHSVLTLCLSPGSVPAPRVAEAPSVPQAAPMLPRAQASAPMRLAGQALTIPSPVIGAGGGGSSLAFLPEDQLAKGLATPAWVGSPGGGVTPPVRYVSGVGDATSGTGYIISPWQPGAGGGTAVAPGGGTITPPIGSVTPSPVPLPLPAAMLPMGLVALAWLRRRRS